MNAYYGAPGPFPAEMDLPGSLIVIEGPDGVGRSTQIALLTDWLEDRGHAVKQVGLSRSRLTAPELAAAKQGHELRPFPLALFYAADFFDQLETEVLPALEAGMVVLSDRYVHTLIARAVVRGLEEARMKRVYENALVPDEVFRLDAPPEVLVERLLAQRGQLDYWESGMDMGISTDWYTSFLTYQGRLRQAWSGLEVSHPFTALDGHRSIQEIHQDLKGRLKPLLRKAKPANA